MKLVAGLVLGSLLFSGSAAMKEITGGEAVVREMHARYEKSWYDTMKFIQKSTTYNPDGTTKVETWYEAAILPGKLRIDFGSPSDGNTALLTGGKAFLFQNGKLKTTRPQLNMLLVLGFDVYRQSPETTLAQLKQEGFNVDKFHEDSWQGEPAYVVGADKGDLQSKQFWVEKRRLLFVRIIEPDSRDPNRLDDIRFTDYRQLTRGLIAARVEVHSEGKLVFTEDYSEIQTDLKLDPAFFDPKQVEAAYQTR
jgi:hypothetical protein